MDELFNIFESSKGLKKQDVKTTEKKLEKDVVDLIDNNEINFLNNFLKKGEKIDGKTYKSIDVLVNKYKQKIGSGKVKNDPNLQMLAPIIAAIYSTLKN